MRTAVCFACNEAYIPLCKGLVLSLAEALRFAPDRDFSLHFIDIGCERASLDWLEAAGTQIHASCFFLIRLSACISNMCRFQ